MSQPLVTVIVVCHNQAPFVREALESVFAQSYTNIEIIVVDDGSQDHSISVINDMEQSGMKFRKILTSIKQGYCRSFNKALSLANGKYIIDLAADDALLPERVEEGVAALQNGDARINFCDAYYIDELSRIQGTHYRRDSNGRILDQVPEGDIFKQLLARYFICTPTMMIDKEVLDTLGGYDEELYYEDFDFWVRSSRHYKYCFTNKVLVKKRVHKESMSKAQYQPKSKMLPTTLKVCQKAYELCRTKEEFHALGIRIRYELRQAVISNNYSVGNEFHKLLGRIKNHSVEYWIWAWLLARSWNFSFLAQFMGKAR